MDLFKAITGKNPAEFEQAAKILVNTPDVQLFAKLVKQDDFLFDFVKNNVAKRIRQAINKNNFKNVYSFLDFYSPSYDEMFAEVLFEYDKDNALAKMKEFLKNGTSGQKAYAVKYLSLCDKEEILDLIPQLREFALCEDDYIAMNAIEVLSKIQDDVSKNQALERLNSNDEFEQYEAVKFLTAYGAKDTLPEIIKVMKKSSLSENIASELPYLISLEELIKQNLDDAILVMCNIINAVPEIISPDVLSDYNLLEIFENLYSENLTSSSALLLRMAKEKFKEFEENDEYLFDCDKNTKEEISRINIFLEKVNINKLNSLLYDELYEESDFVFFAVDYVNDVEELETLLDGSNQTLILKVLTALKEKQALNSSHKQLALKHITSDNIKQIVEAL